jgi:iron complex outermembrane receptor protein
MKANLRQASAWIALMVPSIVMAQTGEIAPEPGSIAAEQAELQAADIIVTGTSIRGVAPVGSALISVGRTEIDASPAVSTGALLQETPQVFNYGISDSSRSGSGGSGNITYSQGVNIRGIGPFATLTLINGRRVVPQGTVGATVDPSTIPTIGIDRLEIIADGASAVYGSDAVAGVANIILRRNYKGLEVSARQGFGADYRDFQASAIAGKTWSTGQVTLAFQHSYRSNVNGRDRDFYQADLRPRGGLDYRSNLCAPGNIVVGGVSYAIPEGGATSANLVPNTQNLCDDITYTDIIPQQEYNSASLTFDQDITNGVRFYFDGYLARRDFSRLTATQQTSFAVPSNNPFYVAPAGVTPPPCAASVGAPAGSRCVTVQYSFADVLGPTQVTDGYSKGFQGTAGLVIDLPREWKLDVYGSYGYNDDRAFARTFTVNTGALSAALRSSDPATAFNPFGTGGNNPAVIAGIADYLVMTPGPGGRAKQVAAEAKLDGPLFELPGGAVRSALGLEYLRMDLKTGQFSGTFDNVSGKLMQYIRTVKSAYGELFVPIFGDDNAVPGFYSLDLDVAVRYDSYSDAGSTTNPKIGVNWQPIRGLRAHGSYGRSFRAPGVTQIVPANGGGFYIQNYFDPTVGHVVQGVAQSGPNRNLEPETAETWSLGLDYQPEFVRGLKVGLNYFNIAYDKQIFSYLSNLNVLRQEAIYSSVILRDAAAQARVLEQMAAGVPLNRGTMDQLLAATVYVDGRNRNLGSSKTTGIDFDLSYQFETENIGAFNLTLRGTKFISYDMAITPTSPALDRLNFIDNPLEFRARGAVGWSKGGASIITRVNYQGSYNNDLAAPTAKVSSYTTVDLIATYTIQSSSRVFNGLRFGLEATNLFNVNPPFVDLAPVNNGGGGYDPQAASPIGRIVAISFNKKF